MSAEDFEHDAKRPRVTNDAAGEEEQQEETIVAWLREGIQSGRIQWRRLPQEYRENRHLVLEAIKGGQHVRWTDLSWGIRNDRGVLLEAIRNGILEDWEDVSTRWRNDREFWRDIVENGAWWQWHDLPPYCPAMHDLDFARSLSTYPSYDFAYHMLRTHPALQRERVVWWKIINSLDPGDDNSGSLSEIVGPLAPPEIRADRELMIQACHADKYAFDYVDEAFRGGRSFVTDLLEGNPNHPVYFPVEVLTPFRDLVYDYILQFSEHLTSVDEEDEGRLEIQSLASNIAPHLLDDPSFIETWFIEAGLPFVLLDDLDNERVFPEEWRGDRRIFLLIAEHCHEKYRRWSFAQALPTLRGDKEFVAQVLKRDPSLFGCVAEELQQDVDLALIAFAGMNAHRWARRDFITQFLRSVLVKATEKLQVHESFVNGFLLGMFNNAGPDCGLSLLVRDEDTSLAFKKMVAEFLDVPTGEELRLLRRVANNLSVAVVG